MELDDDKEKTIKISSLSAARSTGSKHLFLSQTQKKNKKFPVLFWLFVRTVLVIRVILVSEPQNLK